MPTELEELVGFLHSPQPQVVQIALDNLVGYSQGANQQIFAYDNYEAIKDLKHIAQQQGQTIVAQSLTILANLCDNIVMRDLIVEDDKFVEFLVNEICNFKNRNADLMCILLTNLAKNDAIIKVMDLKIVHKHDDAKKIFKSNKAMDCLMDCFVKGFDKALNPDSDYDYLAYFFADISRFPQGRSYFVTEQTYDGVVPLQKLLVFTEKYDSKIRREGVASTIKNSLFDTDSHQKLVHDEKINILPYILLPIAGPEEIDEDEMFDLPEELQLLPSEKVREPVNAINCTHLESLLLLSTTREIREFLKEKSVYSIVKQIYNAVDDENVAELCDRLVQMLKRDEAPISQENVEAESEDEDEDDKIVEVV